MGKILSSIGLGAAALMALPPAWAQTSVESGTPPPMETFTWDRVQARLAFATNGSSLRASEPLPQNMPGTQVSSIALIGNYYLSPSLNQLSLNGLRATGGVVTGQRSAWWGLPGAGNNFAVDRRYTGAAHNPIDTPGQSTNTPYFGIGYSGLVGSKGNWGFSADLGLMSLNPGSVGRLGRVINGSQNLDDMVRDLRLSPVLQLGISYNF